MYFYWTPLFAFSLSCSSLTIACHLYFLSLSHTLSLSLSSSSLARTQKDDVRKMRKRLIEQQSAHMVNVFEEHFHMGPTGPTKMFQLHAEGELVGFIVGGYVFNTHTHTNALIFALACRVFCHCVGACMRLFLNVSEGKCSIIAIYACFHDYQNLLNFFSFFVTIVCY